MLEVKRIQIKSFHSLHISWIATPTPAMSLSRWYFAFIIHQWFLGYQHIIRITHNNINKVNSIITAIVLQLPLGTSCTSCNLNVACGVIIFTIYLGPLMICCCFYNCRWEVFVDHSGRGEYDSSASRLDSNLWKADLANTKPSDVNLAFNANSYLANNTKHLFIFLSAWRSGQKANLGKCFIYKSIPIY